MKSKHLQFSSPVLMLILIFALSFTGLTDSRGSNNTRPNEAGPVLGLYVNTYTGNLYYSRHDISIPGRGISLDISFSYNSGRSNSNWGYGNGWTSSFSLHYVRKGDNVLIESNDGQRDEYTWNGVSFSPPPGIHFRLNEYESGKFILISHHGFKYYFDDPSHGKITSMEDRNGNSLTFNYTEGFLSSITDTAGRILLFEWSDRQLIRIIDNNSDPSRAMSYQYDGFGNMTVYTDPLGNTTQYEYDEGGRMISLTDERIFTTDIQYDSNKAVESIGFSAASCLMSISYQTEEMTTTVSRQMTEGNQITVYHFNEDGIINHIVNHNGDAEFFEWDEDLNLTSYTDQNGHRTEQYYDDKGNIVRQVDAMGFEVLYTYELTYNLVTERTDRLGNVSQFSYDASGNLLSVTDAAGNSDTYTYDSHGNRTQITDRNGNTYEYNYDSGGNITQITDPLGNNHNYTYDNVGNKLSETDPNGNTTTYTYDLLSRLLSITYPDGNISSYSYDPVGNRISETDPLGNTTHYIHDPLNRLFRETDPMNNTIDYSYDPLGNRISETDKNGNVTYYSYDPLNRLVEIRDALNYTISYSYDPVGNRISETDANGNVSNYSYDPLNRLVNREDAMGNLESFVYDAEGNLISYTDKTGNNTYLIYDNLNRRVKKIDPLGNICLYYYDPIGNMIFFNDPNEIIYSYTYDAMNRLISSGLMSGATINYSYDPVGNRISETDPMGNMTSYSYDPMNRLITETDPAGLSLTYTYDPLGNRISETDKNGNVTNYSYDTLNRLINTSDALNNTTGYTYDNNGNTLTATDPNGHVTTYSYDALNRLTTKLTAAGNKSMFEYDGAGSLVKRTDPNGSVTDYEYDPLNRLIATVYPVGRVERSYDPAGNMTEMRNIDIGIEDRTLRTYDNSNRLISESITYGSFSKTVSYAYDPGGRIVEMIDPDGNGIIRNYDNDNRLLGLNDALTGLSGIISDPNGQNTRTDLPNGEYNNSEYDVFGRLLNRSVFNPDGTALFEHSHSYDAMGNRVQSTKNGLSLANFTYDELNRLSTANYPWEGQNISYEYDPAGNRISKTVNTEQTLYYYNEDNRVILQTFPDISTINYNYDNNGNVIQTSSAWGIVNYEYDYENRLTRIEYPDPYGAIENFFSPEGKRLARMEKGEMKYYFPTLFGNILEMDSNGNTMVKINPGVSISRKTPAVPSTPGYQHIYTHWGEESSTTEFTSEGIFADFEFDYFGSILTNTGDTESVDPGLYASGYKVDWDPILGAELIGIDYAPDIDQHYGNIEPDPVFFFEPGSDPFVDIVYSIYRNDRKQQDLSQGFGPGSDPFEDHVYSTVMPYQSIGLINIGPENLDNTPGIDGSSGKEGSNMETEPCGHIWNDWETTGTFWVYLRACRASGFSKRVVWLFEKKMKQKEWQNICMLDKGHPAHHQKTIRNSTGRTQVASYTPPKIKPIYSAPFAGDWPKKDVLDKMGKEKENELNNK